MQNPKAVLLFRSDYDIATQYLAAYMSLMKDLIFALGCEVTDLYATDATEEKFLTALETADPLYIIASGHGNPEGFYGQNDQLVLKACINDDVMSARIGMFWSCSTGVSLGPSMFSKNAEAYIGFQNDFIFIIREEGIDPLADEYAKGFFEPLIAFAEVLLAGGSLREAYEAAVAKWNEWITYWWTSPDPVASQIITYLIWDRDSLVVISKEGIYVAAPKASKIPIIMIPVGLAILALGKP